MATKHHPTPEERDERVSLPLPADVAVEAFLAVDPATEPDRASAGGTDVDHHAESGEGR